SSSPVTSASIRRRLKCSAVERMSGLVPRRSWDECVESRPKLQPVLVQLLKNLVLGAREDQVAASEQIAPEAFDRRCRDNFVPAGRDHQDRLTNARRIRWLGEQAHLTKRCVRPSDRRRTKAKRRFLLQDRGIARITDRI